jgi:hypothetical protein
MNDVTESELHKQFGNLLDQRHHAAQDQPHGTGTAEVARQGEAFSLPFFIGA